MVERPGDREVPGGQGRTVAEPPTLDAAFVLRWVRGLAGAIHEHRDYLTQLDAAIGDADHGVNMDRGFAAALGKLEADAGSSPGDLL
jgi:dihydroxyacetone kinase-like protein